jgi:hypothetical protein
MLKWLFQWSGKSRKSENGNKPNLTTLYLGDRGIGELHENNAELRLWLPEPLRMAMEQSCQHLIIGESSYLREFLVIYLYGIHELLRMHTEKTGLYFVPPPVEYERDTSIRFSRVRMDDIIPGLGKNIVACKLRLPLKMKTDLQLLADKRSIPLGRFVREILIQHFLGHTVWPDAFIHTLEQQNIADDWVEGNIEAISLRLEDVDHKKDTPIKDIWY